MAERRVAALIARYADRAPTNVDPARMAQFAATAGHGGPTALRFIRMDDGLGSVLLALAMGGVLLAGALAGGGRLFRRDRAPAFSDHTLVAPFVALPPEGAPPSSPETGELVLSFDGRVYAFGLTFHRVWVYADGRLIWIREGATTGVIEQRLTAEGVDRLQSEAISKSSRLLDDAELPPFGESWYRPGVLWGGMRVRIGDRLRHVAWDDATLPERLADPASWLPPSSWADQRIGAFVPSRYAVCFEHFHTGAGTIDRSRLLDLLPEAAQSVIRSGELDVRSHDASDRDPRCLYQVTTDDARTLADLLAGAGLPRDNLDSTRYDIDISQLGVDGQAMVELLPVLPDGGLVCNCG